MFLALTIIKNINEKYTNAVADFEKIIKTEVSLLLVYGMLRNKCVETCRCTQNLYENGRSN